MNTFGRNLRLTTWGESHGPAVGGVLDGFPPGVKIDFEAVMEDVARRRPGSTPLTSARDEADTPEWLSGLSPEGITLGTPIAFMTRNRDSRSRDYDALATVYRPNHADYTYDVKYGIRDYRGGGRASARETFARVVAGALARQWLASKGVRAKAVLCAAGDVSACDVFGRLMLHPELPPEFDIDSSTLRLMHEAIARAKAAGESIGGAVACMVTGIPAGTGEPVYGKLHAHLAEAMMGINAAKGFEYGLGMASAHALGSQTADIFTAPCESTTDGEPPRLATLTNYSGGIQGGIANGMPVYMKVAFKPTPTVMRPMPAADRHGNMVTLPAAGRHDPCVALRAVPVVEAMALLTVADMMLEHCLK